MQLACGSWSYHSAFRAGRIDQREWLRVCAQELEVDAVELLDIHFPTTDPAYLRDLKKLCVDLHLTIAGLAVSNDFGAADRRLSEMDKVRRWCDIAAYLGAPVVRVFAGWVPATQQYPAAEQGRIVGLFRKVIGPRPLNSRRLWSDATWALRQCTDYAAERGITLVLQNNHAGGIVGTASQIDQCCRDVGSPWLRVCLDPADLPAMPGLESVLPRVVLAHARLRDIADDGSDTSAHWPELLRTLKLARYRGFVVLDYEGAEEPDTAVPRAARYMRGLIHLLQRQQVLAESAGSPDGAAKTVPAEYAVAPAQEPAIAR